MLIRDCSSLQSLGHLLHWTKQNLEVPIVRLTKSQENSCLQVGGRISPVCLPKRITKKKKSQGWIVSSQEVMIHMQLGPACEL